MLYVWVIFVITLIINSFFFFFWLRKRNLIIFLLVLELVFFAISLLFFLEYVYFAPAEFASEALSYAVAVVVIAAAESAVFLALIAKNYKQTKSIVVK